MSQQKHFPGKAGLIFYYKCDQEHISEGNIHQLLIILKIHSLPATLRLPSYSLKIHIFQE